MSGFSFMDAAEERDSESDDRNSLSRPSVSGFGFMGNRSESDTSDGPSGFMSTLTPEELADMKAKTSEVSHVITEEDGGNIRRDHEADEEEEQSSSGFGFLGGIKEEEGEVGGSVKEDREGESSGSGFGFLSSPSTSTETMTVTPDSMTTPKEEEKAPATMPVKEEPVVESVPLVHSPSAMTPQVTQEIKLASSSAATTKVRKKKRTSKVGAQRHTEAEKEIQETPPTPPVAEKMPVIKESTTPPPVPEPQPPAPVTTAPVTTAPPPQTTPTLSPTPEEKPSLHVTPEPSKVVHLADKPAISTSSASPSHPTRSPHSRGQGDTMSDISEDNSVGSSRSASSSSKQTKKGKSKSKSSGGFMSYFTKKKEVEEEKKPVPESAAPYKPNTRASKKLVVQNPPPETPPVTVTASTKVSSPTQSSQDQVWKRPTPPSTPPPATTTPTVDPRTVLPTSPVTRTEETPVSVSQEMKKEKSAPSPPVRQRTPSPPPGPQSILVQDDQLCLRIQQLSREVISNFQTSVQDITSFQSTLLHDMRDAQKQKDKSELKCRQLQQQIHDMEIEQNELAEKEEFEQADRLTDQLEALQQEYTKYLDLDKQSMTAYEEAESSLKDCRQELSNKMNETSHGLSNLIRQQVEELNNLVTVNLKALSSEDNRVSVEEERIAMEMQHVGREETTLSEETAVIESAILSQTSDVQRDKEEMQSDLLGVAADVERLTEELALKQQEHKMLEMNLLVAEGKIKEVRRKYDRQLQRIADRSATIAAASEECRVDDEAIKAQRTHFFSEKSKLTSMENEITKYIQNMENERDLANNLRETFDTVLMNTSASSSAMSGGGASGGDTDTSQLREKVIAQETHLEKSIIALDETRGALSALSEEDSDLKEKIPVLELEKKSHASNKRFKEAASVAKDIKAMVARKEDIAMLLQEQEGQVSEREAAVEEARKAVDVALAELTAAERVADLAKFESLVEQAKSLRVACRSAEKAKDKSIEVEGAMAGVALELLSAELKVLLDEAGEIKEKHGLEAPLLPPLEEEEKEEEEEVNKEEDEKEEGEKKVSDQEQNVENGSESQDDNIADKQEEENENVVTTEDISADQEEEEQPEQQQEEAKRALIPKAQAMVMSIKSLEADLEVAVDTEEYDDAAELSEKVDELTEQLSEILSTLSWTRQDLESSILAEEDDA